MKFRIRFLATVLLVVGGIASAGPGEGPANNPAPEAALKTFNKFDLRDLAGLQTGASDASRKAEAKIAQHLREQVAPIVAAWNVAAAKSGSANSLLVEPQIVELKFVGGSKRFWVGALAGSSYVILKVKMTEQPSGRVIGEPVFYQRAQAMGGAYTMGGSDNDMLQRIVGLVTSYLTSNYDAPVGGATGRKGS